ncbi:MAG TPA: 4a-hydroxytetrahydrobiopterin dehydratase [Thermopolyspora sp.]|jgi:Pterin-4a-carbinolamine dehydratase
MNRDLLTEAALSAVAKEIPEWRVTDGRMTRDVTCPTFPEAIELVRRIAAVAEELNHHPDIDIRWRTVHLALSTHDRGGITEFDVELARRIERLI